MGCDFPCLFERGRLLQLACGGSLRILVGRAGSRDWWSISSCWAWALLTYARHLSPTTSMILHSWFSCARTLSHPRWCWDVALPLISSATTVVDFVGSAEARQALSCIDDLVADVIPTDMLVN